MRSARNMGPFMMADKRPGARPLNQMPPMGPRPMLLNIAGAVGVRRLSADTTEFVDDTARGILPWRYRA